LAECNGELIIGDWKTGKCKDKKTPEIYPEHLYQVSAYVKAYNFMNKTSIKKAFILVLAKDKPYFNFRIMEKEEITDCFNRVFLPCLSIYDYQKGQKK